MRLCYKLDGMLEDLNVTPIVASQKMNIEYKRFNRWLEGKSYPNKKEYAKLVEFSGYSKEYWESEDRVDKNHKYYLITRWISIVFLLIAASFVIFANVLTYAVQGKDYKELNTKYVSYEIGSFVEMYTFEKIGSDEVSCQLTNPFLDTIEFPNVVSNGGKEYKVTCIIISIECANRYLVFPENVKNIMCEWIMRDSEILGIKVDENNKYYDSRNNCNGLYNSITNELILTANNFVIQDNTKIIGQYTMQRCSGDSIKLPSSVEVLQGSSFYNVNVKELIINEGLTTIENNAFSWCNIGDVLLPSTLLYFDTYGLNKYFGYNNIFYNGNEKKLRSITYRDELDFSRVKYYSEYEPVEKGKYWHYDENNNIVIWE